MKILITGNMGYIGPVLAKFLRENLSELTLIGFDKGYFAHCIVPPNVLPETYLDRQVFGDMRKFPEEMLDGVDSVIHLAAISNDPMGKEFEEVTYEVNYKSSVALAKVAKKKGVGHFVFASSCSIYGFNDKKACDEKSELNPLTAYAKSKVYTEQELEPLADENFIVTCCRFATACGASPRIRLDLVLNDFVASAIATNKITILSDGTPWRPLINTIDMSRALEWGSRRSADKGGNFLAVNTGTGSWNYQVKDLALEVQKIIPGVEISINSNAQPDKRSYKVDFSLFESLAGASAPQTTLADAIRQVREVLEASGFLDTNFRASKEYIRLNMLRYLQDSGRFDKQLF